MRLWQLSYHPDVARKDIARIDQAVAERIGIAILERLTTDPEQYGQPLRRELFGFRKLRVGDYRVVYQVRKQEVVVYVLAVGHRRDSEIYEEALKRLNT